MICTNCGKEIREGDKFCIECGSKIETLLFCTNCGEKIKKDGEFCTNCGMKVRKTETPISGSTIELDRPDAEEEKKLLGIRGWFVSGQKREDMVTSKLVEKAIKERQKRGERITSADIDKIKFANDPIFKQKVIEKVHRDCDREYNNNVRRCENNIKSLEREREKEIKRIEESRWENIVDKKLRYNMTEGKLLINGTSVLFSSIKGAAANLHESYRVEVNESGKSKKHASVGGAVVGGLMFGAVGAIVGGTALGKTTHQSMANTNNIPTATHFGVIVDIDGFQNEVTVLNETVDQDSDKFREALQKAQTIISKLQYLSTVPVPESFLKVEEEWSVVDLQNKIIEAQREREIVKANVPTYEIPKRYL